MKKKLPETIRLSLDTYRFLLEHRELMPDRDYLVKKRFYLWYIKYLQNTDYDIGVDFMKLYERLISGT